MDEVVEWIESLEIVACPTEEFDSSLHVVVLSQIGADPSAFGKQVASFGTASSYKLIADFLWKGNVY